MVAPIDVLYVFTARKRGLLAGVGRGTDPDTLLFGLNQLLADPNHGVPAWEAPSPVAVDFHEPELGAAGRAAMRVIGRLGPDVVQLRTIREFSGRDVVFLTGGWPLVFAARLIPASRRPRIVWLNMTLTNLIRRGGPRSSVLAAAARLADRVACVSTEQQAFLARRLGIAPERLPVVLNGTDAKFFRPELAATPSNPSAPMVLAAGRDAARDYGTLIEALADSGGQVPVQSTIVCSPRNIEGAVLPPNVDARFDVAPSALRDLYARASVVVVPTYGDGSVVGSDCSGTLVTLDALSMGRPVVVTARASVPEYVIPGRHVQTVPAGDVAAMRAAIRQALASDPNVSRVITDQARAGQSHVRATRATEHFAAGIAKVFREVA